MPNPHPSAPGHPPPPPPPHCRPTLRQADCDRILKLYAELRAEAALTHGIPVAVRHLESVVRMSEASARMHLRGVVTDADVSVPIMEGPLACLPGMAQHGALTCLFGGKGENG